MISISCSDERLLQTRLLGPGDDFGPPWIREDGDRGAIELNELRLLAEINLVNTLRARIDAQVVVKFRAMISGNHDYRRMVSQADEQVNPRIALLDCCLAGCKIPSTQKRSTSQPIASATKHSKH